MIVADCPRCHLMTAVTFAGGRHVLYGHTWTLRANGAPGSGVSIDPELVRDLFAQEASP